MKPILAVLSVSLRSLPTRLAQERTRKSAAQKKQQARMKDCNEKAAAQNMKGDDRKKFMSPA